MRKHLSFLPFKYFRNPPALIAVVPLHGAIMGKGRAGRTIDYARAEDSLEAAFKLSGIKAVAVSINSPGGSAVQASMIHDRIRALAAEKKVPVFTFAEDVAASGGYMLMVAGDELYAHPASIIGSIGVIAAGFGFTEAIEKLGIERRMHTAGKNKAMLDPFSPEKAEDVARLESALARIHAFFRDLVVNRRDGKVDAANEELFSGAIWVGQEAVDLGLIDGLGDMKTVLRAKFGDKTRFKVFVTERSWFRDRLGLTKISSADDILDSLEIRSLWNRFGA